VKHRFWLSALTAALLGVTAVPVIQAQERRAPVNFGALETANEEAVKAKALEWYKQTAKPDQAAFDRVWAAKERQVLDRLADTFALGNADAAKLLNDARDVAVPAPTDVPAHLKDAKLPAFYRANLGLAYARSLSNRRVHEEALEVLKNIKAEDVVDPNAYLFHRAVSEHALLLKADAGKSVVRLLTDSADSPERYKTVGALILLDMQTWKEKDLGAIARKMDNVERRLDLARGGPQTQKIQKEIVSRLDELIKEMENQAKNSSQCNGGSCPDGGQPKPGSGNGGGEATAPMQDSNIANNGGKGTVDIAKIRKMAEGFGKLPERERAKVLQEVEDLTRGLSLTHHEQYREYFRRVAERSVKND